LAGCSGGNGEETRLAGSTEDHADGGRAARGTGSGAQGGELLLEPLHGEEGSRVGVAGGGMGAGAGVVRPPRLLFVGTSLTEGLGLDRPEREAWPAQVGELAAAAGYAIDVRNAGLSGETSAGALRRLDWILSGDRFDIFILETGANDGLRALPLDGLESNLDAIFAAVRARAPEAKLILAGMEAPPNLGSPYVEGFREIFPRVARRWDAALIPFLLEGVAGEPELNQEDRIHPTAEGQNRMAKVAWPVIEEVVEAVLARQGGGA
jgi:acyl-CoA thioesterase I